MSWLQSPSAVILEPKKIKSVSISIVYPSICHEVMGPDAMISHEVGQVVWYSHLLKNFPQFIVIHTDKGLGIVNKAEVDDDFLELSYFFDDPMDVDNLISGSSAFSKSI